MTVHFYRRVRKALTKSDY